MYSSHQSEDSNSDQSSSSLISSFNLTSASLANEDRKSKRKIEIKISKSDSQEEEPAPIKSHQVLNKNQDQESDLEQIVKRPKKTEFSEEVSDSDLADVKFPENTFNEIITNSDGNSTGIVPKVSDSAVFWVNDNDLPPQDQALSIDLIFDEILKNLDPSTLKTCRLVSCHWHSIVSKKLEKSTRIRIYTEQDYDSELYSFGFIKKLLTPTGFPLNQMEPFRNLKSVLNENQILFSNFPCSHFVFFKTNLSSGDSEIRQFFTNYGHLVKTLEINLFYLNSINFQDLKTDINFIFENCLNLENLALSSNITEITAQSIDSESLNEGKDVETPQLFSNLKKLKLQTVFPQKLIDLMTDPSRFGGNLQEVAVHLKNLLFFLKTENSNKIKLLKTLEFIPTQENLPIFEKVSFEKKLKLQKFAFSLTWISSQKTKNLWPRVTGILSRILENSQDTLTEITWDSTRYLIEEQGAVFKIPANFKNVQKLNFFIGNLGIPPAMGHEPSNTNSKQFFPPQFQIAQHFPALKEIQLINGRPICEFHFDKYFELTVVGSVRKFKIPDWKFYDPYSCQKFREMFPNVPGHRNNAA